MSNIEYAIKDTVWVLSALETHYYKLPIEAVLLGISKTDKINKFKVKANGQTFYVKQLFDKDSCIDTSLLALKTALNVLNVLRSMYGNLKGKEILRVLDTIDTESKIIKSHILKIEGNDFIWSDIG